MDHAETLERVCAERDAARAECDRLRRDLHATHLAAGDELARSNEFCAAAHDARKERDAARAELAAEAADHQAACERLLAAERERDAAREALADRDSLLREWLAAWERTAEGDRVRATEEALKEDAA